MDKPNMMDREDLTNLVTVLGDLYRAIDTVNQKNLSDAVDCLAHVQANIGVLLTAIRMRMDD